VDILLTPKTGGANGSLSYIIQLNFKMEDPARAYITTPDGTAVDSFDLNNGDTGFGGTGEKITQGTKSLPPGEYQIRLRLQAKQYSGTALANYAGFTEVFHIYSGLTTVLPFKNFISTDFSEAISDLDLTSLITPPVAWASPNNIAETSQYTGGAYWYESDGVTPVSSRDIFAVNTVYKAVVRLETKSGYTFIGVAENSFTHTGAAEVANDEDAGVATVDQHTYGYVTITFPATDNPVVTSVTVTPSTATVLQGGQQTFSAVVAGELGGEVITPLQTVTWSVSGNSSTGTNITSAGLLTVALDETSSSVTVKAASILDAAQYDEATVTVTPLATYIEIDDETELAQIGVDTENYPLGGKYKLMANLTLANWVPLGSNTAPFLGIFDGNNKTITLSSFASTALSSKTYFGIFGYVKGTSDTSRAEVKDLTIVSSVNSTASSSQTVNAGLLAGYAQNVDISNITLSGTFGFTASNALIVGGIAGNINGGANVENCNGSMDMTVAMKGYNDGGVGGFVGFALNGTDIIDCHNTGSITVSTETVTYCGGIAGRLNSTSTAHGIIQGCSSTGNITGAETGSNDVYVGGIAGGTKCASTTSSDPTRITNCWAEGTISGTGGSSSFYVVVGGIVGDHTYGALIAQSYFNGTVLASGSSIDTYAGGIAGMNSNRGGPIEDCWSHGEVTGINNAGGIIGLSEQFADYTRRCYSTADVVRTGSTDNNSSGAGGIAGSNRSTGIDGCVAINSEISSDGGANIHRVAGRTDTAVLSNNHAWSGMTITSGSGTYTADTGADKVDGADKTAAELDENFYKSLGWDFTANTGVWEMDAYGYPKLQWQAAEIARSSL
jgi:hypothetical protein